MTNLSGLTCLHIQRRSYKRECLFKKELLQPGAALSTILAILHDLREHTAPIIAAVLADDVLGRLVQQPGSLLGSLHAALQPIAASFGSWSAASQALRDLAKHKGLQKQLQALHIGRLLLRYSRDGVPQDNHLSGRYAL